MIKKRNQGLLEEIRQLKGEHPFWGYRRVWAYLKYRQGHEVNKKRIYRLMKKYGLLVVQMKQLKALRKNYPQKIRANAVNQVWGIDMTKIMIPTYGWLYLVVVLDWYTKKIVGWHLSEISRNKQWLEALNLAVTNQFPDGIREHKTLCLISDNGSQPTSGKFMKETALLSIKQIFASYDNPKGNADTERVIRTLKEDLVWIKDWASAYEFARELETWIARYNQDYPHSALKYMTPVEFEQIAIKQLPLTQRLNSNLIYV